MISGRACSSLDAMVLRGLKAALPGRNNVVTSACTVGAPASSNGQLVMLSVSSFNFRLMMFIQFDTTEAVRAHLAHRSNVELEQFEEQAFRDAISECGNLACGSLNRDLGSVFTHVGMSTPNIIDCACLRHLEFVRHGYLRHFELEIDHHLRFHASACFCEHENIDFSFEQTEDAAEGGELELF